MGRASFLGRLFERLRAFPAPRSPRINPPSRPMTKPSGPNSPMQKMRPSSRRSPCSKISTSAGTCSFARSPSSNGVARCGIPRWARSRSTIICRSMPGTAATTRPTSCACASAAAKWRHSHSKELIQLDGFVRHRPAGGIGKVRKQRVYTSDPCGPPADYRNLAVLQRGLIINRNDAERAFFVVCDPVARDQKRRRCTQRRIRRARCAIPPKTATHGAGFQHEPLS